MSQNSFDLIVVGAGPVGLTAALFAKSVGLNVLVIEKDLRPVEQSRAIWIHPRTMEIWDSIGMAELAIREGRQIDAIQIRVKGRAKAVLPYQGQGESKFPYGLMLEQSRTQGLLSDLARSRGIEIRWGTTLTQLQDSGGVVRVSVVNQDESHEQLESGHLIGADGGSSTVRKLLGIKLNGGTYDTSFFVVDAFGETELSPEMAHLSFSDVTTIAVLPLPSQGKFRIIGNIVNQENESKEAGYGRSLTLDEVRGFVTENNLPIKVEKIGWSSTYRSHHRVADTFRRGRVLLTGDAGHLHSPAGGLGMNTGVADAHSAVLHLADVLAGGPEGLLEEYSRERKSVAENVIKTSDRLFILQADTRAFFAFARNNMLPRVIKRISSFPFGKTVAFKVLSGTSVTYAIDSKHSLKRAGKIKLGVRLATNLLENGSQCAQNTHLILHYGKEAGLLSQMAGTIAEARGWQTSQISEADARNLKLPSRDYLIWVRSDGHVAWIGTDASKLEKSLKSSGR